MALIRRLSKLTKQTSRIHEEAGGSYSIFTDSDAGTILQIDTYGSTGRKLEGKISQSLQFDESSAKVLLELLKEAFPALRSSRD